MQYSVFQYIYKYESSIFVTISKIYKHMKKHPLLLFFLLIFLITTSTTCENYDYEETYVPCTLTGVEVYSWDNAGAEPQVPIEQKIKKETYLLKIRLLSNAGTQPKQDITNNTYKLKDGIVKINIYQTITFFITVYPTV